MLRASRLPWKTKVAAMAKRCMPVEPEEHPITGPNLKTERPLKLLLLLLLLLVMVGAA